MKKNDKEFNLFCDWYFRAKQDSSYDEEQQFFYFYALFNHLFTTYAEKNKKVLDSCGLAFKNNSEKSKMFFYLYSILYLSNDGTFKTYSPLGLLKTAGKTEIIENIKKKHGISDANIEENKLPDFSVITYVFSEIYDIRCKLFHGETDLSDNENRDLIYEANIVLGAFLDRLFGKNLGE